MAFFYLIDHSLRDSGGHHFDYSRCISRAAADAGLKTVIGCHRKLANIRQRLGLRDLQQAAEVRPVFRQSVYDGPSDFAGLRKMRRDSGQLAHEPIVAFDRWQFIRQTFQQQGLLRRRSRFAARFANDCRRFFGPEKCEFDSSDHIFLATVSELELEGLTRFLAQHPQTLAANWHLQFHFSLFNGRTPEYDSQSMLLESVQTSFLSSLSRLSFHSINFYATSETLADQLNRLNIGRFAHLPYPVADDFRVADAKALSAIPAECDASEAGVGQTRPLRMVCAGSIRREKGQTDQLQELIDHVGPRWMSNGKLKMVVQRPVRKWPVRQKIKLLPPQGAESPAAGEQERMAINEAECSFVEYRPHPLGRDDYVQLIRNADIGLFCYDRQTYFGRCAGVLIEMLASGKPVIVPAGCWLADQIQRPINQHIDRLRTRLPMLRKFSWRDVEFSRDNLPLPGGVLCFDQDRNPLSTRIEVPQGTQMAVVKFDWLFPNVHGTYCHIDCRQIDEGETEVRADRRSVGISRDRSGAMALFRLHPDATHLSISLTNAFDASTISIRSFCVELLGGERESSPSGLPIGSVGVIAATSDALPACVDELMLNYSHYRRSATAHARNWAAFHRPEATIDRLLAEKFAQQRAA